ncbi:glycosyltransferase family 4 protein [Devosia sp.]|uniref:glycosyltransferase family 4 protein n=1 Tax=Devosia sp. TaxID=1871048 RepID=UPI003F701453
MADAANSDVGSLATTKDGSSVRILIVSQFYPPDITAAAFRIGETAELLRDLGHDVRVITAEPHKSDAQVDREADQRQGVIRVRVDSSEGGGTWRYLAHYLSFVRRSAWAGLSRLFGRWRPQVIWATSPPLFVGLTGWFLSRLNHCPLVFDVRDIWPESAVAAGQLSSTGFGFKVGKGLEKWLYDRADHITCVSTKMAGYIASRTATETSVIYNGVSVEYARAVSVPVDRQRILYAGNLGRAQALDAPIRGFARVAGEAIANGWCLEFLGNGALKDELQALATELGVKDRIVFHVAVPKEDALNELARSAVLLISLKSDAVFDLTIPSKVFDYLAVGRPILFGINGEGRDILMATGANLGFTPGDAESFAAAIREIIRDYEQFGARAEQNPTVVTDAYSREANAGQLAALFERTTS